MERRLRSLIHFPMSLVQSQGAVQSRARKTPLRLPENFQTMKYEACKLQAAVKREPRQESMCTQSVLHACSWRTCVSQSPHRKHRCAGSHKKLTSLPCTLVLQPSAHRDPRAEQHACPSSVAFSFHISNPECAPLLTTMPAPCGVTRAVQGWTPS